ncbi:WbqC family protein [Enterobacter roggenkampii]|uniref:WbqC family protein n=1 Tax=Enterobacter roggenkampii TaxID=1812935 RepID=UPI003458298D
MKLAIMQPYLFPYVGYYQLAAAVDKFVFYDDVNYMKGGWINRNRLIISGQVKYFTLPLVNGSPNNKINEVLVSVNNQKQIRKILESIKFSYSKTQYFKEVYLLIENVLNSGHTNLAMITKSSIVKVLEYCNIHTELVMSSEIYNKSELSSVSRVLDICQKENADTYVNLPGGKALYSEQEFGNKNIKLEFITPNLINYTGQDGYIPGLSIIDILMNVGPNGTKKILLGK